MNENVTQLVDLLFRDVLFSEEVQALHDEVLNNCQDRFTDLLHSGLGEEEALTAVMESLKGMEDVLREYPRRNPPGPETDAKAAPESDPEVFSVPSRVCFSSEEIRAISGHLQNCDVKVLISENDCSLETQGKVHYELVPGGTLRLWQEKSSEQLLQGISWAESLNSFEHFGDAINQLARNLSHLVSSGFKSGLDENRIILRLPASAHPTVNLLTASGDIEWESVVPGSEFTLRSTSGDIRIDVDRSFLLPHVQVGTTSGDAELRFSAENVRLATVSGDITWEGSAVAAELCSTSGDLDLRGNFSDLTMNSTSGDLELELTSPQAAKINVSTVSGDIEVHLPVSVQEISASLKSVSGEIRQRGIQHTDNAPIQLRANTISGDLKLNRQLMDHTGSFRFFG